MTQGYMYSFFYTPQFWLTPLQITDAHHILYLDLISPFSFQCDSEEHRRGLGDAFQGDGEAENGF